MATFYPSLVVNLRVIFDDTLTITVQLPAGQSVDDAAKSAGNFGTPTVRPLLTTKGRQTQIMARVPKEATVELPGHRPAGTFNLTFDYKELPIDPRTVKSAAVDVFVGTVQPDAFADGMKGNSKRSVLDTATREPLLTGLVDEWELTLGENGMEVTLAGRDLRGFLLDTPIATDPRESAQILAKLNTAQPLDDVIAELLSKNPLTAGFTVAVSLGDWPNGIVPSPHGVGGSSVSRHRKGAKGTRIAGKAAGAAQRTSFWDEIVKLCYVVGAIPHFVGSELRIRPARSLYDRKFAGFDPTLPAPFDGGLPRVTDAQSGKPISPLSIRKMIYGRDIRELRFRRKFGGAQRPKQVCCVGIDDSTPLKRANARQIVGVYPSSPVTSKVGASGDIAMNERMYIPGPAGICDVEALTEIAKAVYNEIGRGEVGGTCSTVNLASFGGDNDDPDLLTLRPGDAIQFGTDVRPLRAAAPLVSEYTDHLRNSFEDQVKVVAKRLGSEDLARVVLATAAGQINEVQGYFRVAAVHYRWGSEGIAVDFDFQNYVEASYEQKSEAGPLPLPVQRKRVPGQALGGL